MVCTLEKFENNFLTDERSILLKIMKADGSILQKIYKFLLEMNFAKYP